MRRGGWLGLVLVVGAVSTACDGLLVDPAASPLALELAYPRAGLLASGGVVDAFNKADRVWIRLTAGTGGAQLDTIVRLSRTENSTRIRLAISAKRGQGLVRIETEVRVGPQALFAGETVARLEVGKPQSVAVTLFPVAAAMVLPDSIRTLTAIGDSTRLRATLLFATGDTIPVLSPSWSSEQRGIVDITSGSWAIARGEGQTRVVAQHEALVRARVVRVVLRGGSGVGPARTFD